MLKKLNTGLILSLLLLNANAFCMEEDDVTYDQEENLSEFSINGHALSERQYEQICSLNESLNDSPLFQTSNLKSKRWLEAERDALGGKEILLTTEDNRFIDCWHFDRGKDKVVLVAPGFGGGFEEMLSLVEIYSDYDVVLLDYWGHGSHDAADASATKWYRNPADRFFSERFRREHLDVKAALEHIRTQQYDEVIGAGNCYSTLVLSKVQAEAENNSKKAFDKLIFDSCWLSTYDVAKKVAHNPYLSFDQIHGNAPWILQKFMNFPYLDSALLKLGECALGIDLREHSILRYISDINCPILFIHGTKYKLVTDNELEIILENCNAPKMVFRTPFEHSVGRYKGKEIFKFMADNFITSSPDNLAYLQDGHKHCIRHLLNNYQPHSEPLTHTEMVIRPKKQKLLSIKNGIVGLIAACAFGYVGYTLATASDNKVPDINQILK